MLNVGKAFDYADRGKNKGEKFPEFHKPNPLLRFDIKEVLNRLKQHAKNADLHKKDLEKTF